MTSWMMFTYEWDARTITASKRINLQYPTSNGPSREFLFRARSVIATYDLAGRHAPIAEY